MITLRRTLDGQDDDEIAAALVAAVAAAARTPFDLMDPALAGYAVRDRDRARPPARLPARVGVRVRGGSRRSTP